MNCVVARNRKPKLCPASLSSHRVHTTPIYLAHSGVVITLAADGKEASTEMVRFIKEALFIRTGDGANVVVKQAVDRLHRKHLLGYIQKDHGKPHYKFYCKGFTDAELLQARREYQTCVPPRNASARSTHNHQCANLPLSPSPLRHSDLAMTTRLTRLSSRG